MPGVKLVPIQPKRNPFGSPTQIQRMVDDALDDQVDEVKDQVKAFTGNWSSENQPKITVEKSRSQRVIHIEGEVFGFVDRGTRRHIIRAKRARFLAFQTGYKAKTSPGSITSGKGGASDPFKFRKQVRHPGTKARSFTKAVAKLQKKSFPNRFRAAFKRLFSK